MQKKVCSPGKFLLHYIIDLLIWGIIISIGIALIETIMDTLIDSLFFSSILSNVLKIVFNIGSNFLIVFLTVKGLLKKYTISELDSKSFFNKLIVFYVILFLLGVANVLITETNYIIEKIIALMLNVGILIFGFLYTKHMVKQGLSTETNNYQVQENNSSFNEQQNNTMYNTNQYYNVPTNNEYNSQNQMQNQFQNNQNISNNGFASIENNGINNMNNMNTILNNNEIVNNNPNFNNNIINNQDQTKTCPMCGNTMNINNSFCDKCGYSYNN